MVPTPRLLDKMTQILVSLLFTLVGRARAHLYLTLSPEALGKVQKLSKSGHLRYWAVDSAIIVLFIFIPGPTSDSDQIISTRSDSQITQETVNSGSAMLSKTLTKFEAALIVCLIKCITIM